MKMFFGMIVIAVIAYEVCLWIIAVQNTLTQ
jgi:hypothetical protein